jgi:SOS-response transcriptional repressor LexA
VNASELKHSLRSQASIVDKLPCIFYKVDIGKRIETARIAAGLDRNQLAAACGITYQAVQQWETGRTKPGAKALLNVARATNSNPGWLVEGKGTMATSLASEPKPLYTANTEPTGWPLGQVPLISNITAGNWCEAVDNFHPGDAEEWIPCPARHSKNAYALRVTGSSMEPKFREGEIIVVDPEIASSPYVVAKKVNSNEVTLKQLVMECGECYLKAVNPHWPEPIIKMTEDWVICGTVICKIEIF